MRQLDFFPEELTYKDRFALYDELNRSVIVCDRNGSIVYRNDFCAKEFPQIRRGSQFSRICGVRFADDTVSFADFLGEKRFVLCSAQAGGFFRIDIPGGFVAERKNGLLIRKMWDNGRSADPLPRSKEQAALTSLASELVKCLESLENDCAPEMNVSVCDLFSAVSRRIRGHLDKIGAQFRYSCPKNLLCRASLGDPVFTLLNIICFLTVYSGQKDVNAVVTGKKTECEIRFEADDHARAAKYLFRFFTLGDYAGLDLAPLVLAFEGAKRSNGSLSCFARAGKTGLIWTLPLVVGRTELTVLDPDAILTPFLAACIDGFFDQALKMIDLG
ncbi:MAG: hypothetical protein IJV00_03450 [Clostridia bacterium]|nr:hypothetical protein [Clostridia bacterium]